MHTENRLAGQIDREDLIALVKGTDRFFENDSLRQDITCKGRADYVTKVDLSIQAYLKEALETRYPQIGFLGEEGEKEELDWTVPMWILDPVDGTANLIYGRQESCVSLGLWDGTALVLGCIYQPWKQEIYYAETGSGATLNGRPIHVSAADSLRESLVNFGTTPYDKTRTTEIYAQAKKIADACQDLRRSGSAALDLCSVAAGRADCYFEYDLKVWDVAAGAVILREAGGSFADLSGKEPMPAMRMDVAASNGILQDVFLKLLAE